MKEEEWEEYLERSRKWMIRIDFELLHSDAYRRLKYGPALKVLNWFFEKVKFKVDRNKRGRKRYQTINDGELSFTYREAHIRGLTDQQFRRSLEELVQLGFIDVKKAGSGLRGDYTIFLLSQRWKEFGTPNFEKKEFPESVYGGDIGYRKRKKVSSENSSLKRLISVKSQR